MNNKKNTPYFGRNGGREIMKAVSMESVENLVDGVKNGFISQRTLRRLLEKESFKNRIKKEEHNNGT